MKKVLSVFFAALLMLSFCSAAFAGFTPSQTGSQVAAVIKNGTETTPTTILVNNATDDELVSKKGHFSDLDSSVPNNSVINKIYSITTQQDVVIGDGTTLEVSFDDVNGTPYVLMHTDSGWEKVPSEKKDGKIKVTLDEISGPIAILSCEDVKDETVTFEAGSAKHGTTKSAAEKLFNFGDKVKAVWQSLTENNNDGKEAKKLYAGNTYTGKVTITPNDGYNIDKNTQISLNNATVKGKEYNSDGSVTLTVEFTAQGNFFQRIITFFHNLFY